MKHTGLTILLLVFVLALGACSNSPITTTDDSLPELNVATGNVSTDSVSVEEPSALITYGSQTDGQGRIEFVITPINLDGAGNILEFEVGMNTHSVDLSMDLATLATLTTDTGQEVSATLWDAPQGGHHISGILSFPAMIDGVPLLDNAQQLTVTIQDVDAPIRTFVCQLQ